MPIKFKDRISKDKSGRYEELDVLRGLAAVGVMVFHYTTCYPPNFDTEEIPLFTFPWGFYGPHLFFMISGFVILMTLEKTSHPMDFIVSRFSRLYPAYWVAAIVTYYAVTNFLMYPSMLLGVTFKDLLVNLSMLQSWFYVKNVDEAYWTLAVELTFYLALFLVYMAKGLKYIEIWGLVWLGIMIFNKFLPQLNQYYPYFKALFYYLFRFGEFFLAGILFYKLKTNGNTWYRHLGLACCLLVSFLVDGREEAVVFSVFIIVFYLFVFNKLRFLVNKPLLFLGTISYSLYLIHSKTGYVLKEWVPVFTRNQILTFLIPVTFSIILATLITFLIEKPAMKFIRQAYKNIKAALLQPKNIPVPILK